MQLTYKNGDFCGNGINRSVNYIFHCSNKSTRVGLSAEPKTCVYNFDIYSKYACFDTAVKQTSYMWILYYALFAVIIYFAVGWVLNKYKDPDSGLIEAIPHSEKFAECIEKISTKSEGV